ncbi:hypothetical protein FOZ63_018060 [Perkinsus olseni]|uniref:Phytase-like domain-containing protein n=1 Tax=Perkinsus olseni TaxID=32597 RepID=A0A7J6R0G8_PEROL|nr:hypothetical protein FOZ60_003355 [Perkinsus olseni]KAF4712584.1 hypothetical protein FOZ63_018060 [Perkinsus olseni]KAF4713100.1 hypothetical protein FOZ62_017762 [Perkinsus olseni]
MFTSVFLAVLLGIATGQGTVVEIEQSNLPLRNNSQEKILRSSLGTLRHVQTLQLVGVGVNGRNFRYLSSLAVTADGSEMLAVNDDGLFIDIKIKPISGGVFEVLGATTFPMRDPQGKIIPFGAQGLAVEGIYQGRGIGNFFVSSLADKQVYRFPNGIKSRQSVDLGLTDVFGDCRHDEGPEAILRPEDKSEFSLLMFCRVAMSLAPTSTPGREVFIGFAYNKFKNVAKRFYLESTRRPWAGTLQITDMAELSNGDIMVLFSEFKEDIMTIGYVRRKDLSRALSQGETVKPVSIADISRREKYNIGEEVGLAVREDPKSGKTFVYIVNHDFYGEAGVTLLTTFEWKTVSR